MMRSRTSLAAGPVGFDRWDTLYPLAPKPMLVAVSARDFSALILRAIWSNGRMEFEPAEERIQSPRQGE